MLKEKRVVVVMPAYNAEKTLRKTYAEIPKEIVDEVIVVDDQSRDRTAEIARSLNINTIVHSKNRGYGGNQKTCYKEAMKLGADIVIMVHPDYQYTPRLITAMASVIAEGLFDCMLGSRILGVGALSGGMPRYKYVANRVLTLVQNLLLGYKLSEYHTGYRAFSRKLLEKLPLENNDDDFVFDNQMLSQIIYAGFNIGEVTCPTRYMEDSSSIGFHKAVLYGIGVINTSVTFRLHRLGLLRSHLFAPLDGTPT
ncbi:MAG: glycosyltransferase family 2 protein [Desulfobacterales bacterium]|nr:glycosyltransferase family 2 protein [Desulfobacterales bacterium]